MVDPSVVVVGGGYAGTAVAARLDRHAAVTLVEPRDAFVHNIAALRALVHPTWLDGVFLPYDGLLARGRVVQDRAVVVEPGRVETASGAVLPADVVVLATGSRYPFPAKPSIDDAAEASAAAMRSAHEELARSQRVLLVGAGAVGVELSAEVALAWPDKEVVLVDEAPRLLGATAHSDRLRASLREQLEALGVTLRLGTTLAGLPPGPPARHGPFEVGVVGGRPVQADLWFRCFGVEPASDVLGPSLVAARRADGSVAVDSHLRVEGQGAVFALGDVSSADAKMAGLALIQASVVAANVKAHLRGEAPTRAYEPVGPTIMVAVGPDGGAGESPVGFHEGDEVAAMKGRDLLTGFFRDLLGAPVLPSIP